MTRPPLFDFLATPPMPPGFSAGASAVAGTFAGCPPPTIDHTGTEAPAARSGPAQGCAESPAASQAGSLTLPLPQTREDKLLEASQNFLAAEESRERGALLKATGNPVAFQQRRPKDILRKSAVAPFEFDEVPRSISKLARSFCDATGFDRSGALVAATAAAASAIDDRFRLVVNPSSNWTESARLWAVLIGSPSAGKSPTVRWATDPIKLIHKTEVDRWEAEQLDTPPEDLRPRPAVYTSDATIQALSDRLRGNPRGMLMLTEEFSSWIGGIDAADRGEAASNRGHWLQLYDGGEYQIDRVGRGSFLVPNWGASVVAACTPVGLRQHMKQLPDDGLIHRFIPAIMGSPDIDAQGDCQHTYQEWHQALQWVYGVTATLAPTPRCSFDAEAKRLFDQEHRDQRLLADATSDSAPAFASHLGKHGGMLARVCLVFHLLSESPGPLISPETVTTAIRFMRRVRKHAHAMFEDILGASSSWALARQLGRSIVADAKPVEVINRDWMTQHCGAFRKESDETVRREAVRILEDADWLEAKVGKSSYGGWPRQWHVHSGLFDMFADEGRNWRERRAAVKRAIMEGSGNED